MPDASGRIVPTVVPSVPWLQAFEVGEHVRIAKGVAVFGDIQGRVVRADDPQRIHVALDALAVQNQGLLTQGNPAGPDDPVWVFSPGELRRLS